jgi:hypothetical protein
MVDNQLRARFPLMCLTQKVRFHAGWVNRFLPSPRVSPIYLPTRYRILFRFRGCTQTMPEPGRGIWTSSRTASGARDVGTFWKINGIDPEAFPRGPSVAPIPRGVSLGQIHIANATRIWLHSI